jgi:hypothetical protein
MIFCNIYIFLFKQQNFCVLETLTFPVGLYPLHRYDSLGTDGLPF